MLKMSSTSVCILSQPLFITWDSFVLRKIFWHLHCNFLIQKLFLASDKAFKKLRASLWRQDICRRFKFWSSVVIASSESFAVSFHAGIVEWHTLRVQSPMQFAESAVVHHPTAVFNKFGKQKFLTSNFNYCLRKIITKITLQWRHCRVKLVSLYV